MSELVHAVMYRDYKIGTLCDSGAWGPPMLFTMITEKVTCPGCRTKLDGVAPAARASDVRAEDEGVTNVRRFCMMMLGSISLAQRETAQEVLDLLDADR